jgi:hypothetical protein
MKGDGGVVYGFIYRATHLGAPVLDMFVKSFLVFGFMFTLGGRFGGFAPVCTLGLFCDFQQPMYYFRHCIFQGQCACSMFKQRVRQPCPSPNATCKHTYYRTEKLYMTNFFWLYSRKRK